MRDLHKVETKRRPDRFSCHFVFLTANILILLLNTKSSPPRPPPPPPPISPVLETCPWVLKAQRNTLGWWYASFKILALILCRPWRFRQLQCVNCGVIIHCLSVSCTKINHSCYALVIWSLQLTSKQWIITQQFTARADLFLKIC